MTDPNGPGGDAAGTPGRPTSPDVAAAAEMDGDGTAIATNSAGRKSRCPQLNCWPCFAKCPRRM